MGEQDNYLKEEEGQFKKLVYNKKNFSSTF